MRNLKKVLALVIAFSMMLSVVAFAGYNDVAEDADYAGAVELLSALEIIKGDDQGNFNPDNTITRSEMAAIICRALGLESAATGAMGATAFTDVAADHWASGYVNLASQNGIIAGYGDGKFGPEDTLTYEAAVAMIVRALGFEPMAAQKGGWSAGYLVVANSYKITAGADNSATRANVAVLMANALNTAMMDQTTFGADAEYEVLNGKNGVYKTLLTGMDIYVATGIVGAKDYEKVGFTVTEDSDGYDEAEFVVGNKPNFEIGDSNIVAYQHQIVDAYVKKLSKSKYEVVAVVPSTLGETFTLLSDDIKDVVDATEITEDGDVVAVSGTVEYYIDPANSSKTKEIKIRLTNIESNKDDVTLAAGALTAIAEGQEDVELLFIDNDGNNVYDVVIATKYTSAIVKTVTPDKNKLEVQVGNDMQTITFDFDAVEDGEDTIILADDAGAELTLADFAEDDVVAILADNASFKKYDKYIEVIKLSNAAVTGVVAESYTSNDKPYITVDGNEYQSAIGEIAVSSEGTFYIGLTGKVIYFDGSAANQNYGYVLAAGISQSAFAEDRWEIMILTEEDGVVTYSTTEDGNADFVAYLEDNEVELNEAENKWAWDTTTPANNHAAYRLVNYKTNSKGEIKEIKVAGSTTAIAADRDYDSNKQKIDTYILEDDVIVFNVDAVDAEDAYATDISYLVDESIYTGFVHKNADEECAVMIVTGGDALFSEELGFAIVTKTAKSKDEAGDDVVKVDYVQDETEGSVVFYDDAVKVGTIGYDSLDIGDVFLFNADASGVVSKYAVIAQIGDNKDIQLKVDQLFLNDPEETDVNEGTHLYGGYILNTKNPTTKGVTIKIGALGAAEEAAAYEAFIDVNTNKYTYVSAGRNVTIETEDFMADDAYYAELGVEVGDAEVNLYTPVIVRVVDGDVVDVYTSSNRIQYTPAE